MSHGIHLREVGILRGHRWEVRWLRFSPDSTRLISSTDEATYMWDVAAVKLLHQFAIDTGPTKSACAFSPSDGAFALACTDGTVRLWSRNAEPMRVLPGHEGGATGVAFSPDGRVLITSEAAGRVRLWDVASWQVMSLFWAVPPEHVLVSQRPHGKRHSLSKQQIRNLHKRQQISMICLLPSGSQLLAAAASSRGHVQVWHMSLTTGHAEWEGTLDASSGERHSVLGLSTSLDGQWLAVNVVTADPHVKYGYASQVHLYHPSSWALRSTINVSDQARPGRTGWVRDISFSPDSRFLALIDADGTLWFWDLAADTITASMQAHPIPPEDYQVFAGTSVDWAATASIVATGGWMPSVRPLSPVEQVAEEAVIKLWYAHTAV